MMLLCSEDEKWFNSSEKELKSGQSADASHRFLSLVGAQVCAEIRINWSNRLCITK